MNKGEVSARFGRIIFDASPKAPEGTISPKNPQPTVVRGGDSLEGCR
jgi:hypothetical protein